MRSSFWIRGLGMISSRTRLAGQSDEHLLLVGGSVVTESDLELPSSGHYAPCWQAPKDNRDGRYETAPSQRSMAPRPHE
jgi:hypothetical protein